MLLHGLRTLVVGGGSGLGRAVAKRFTEAGARVAVFDRDPNKLDAVEQQLGPDLRTTEGDVREVADQRHCLADIGDAWGGLDALIVTAGIVDYVAGFDHYDPDQFAAAFDEVMAVNVRGPLSFAVLATQLQQASTNPSTTFTLSTSAWQVPASGPVYGMAKAALTLAVRQLALDLAPTIRVNGIVPGAILDSDIRGPEALAQADRRSARLSADGASQAVAEANLVGFGPTGADYAGLYVLVASEEGRVATGSILTWDTGLGVVGHRR
jgi:NAD(P)-dependent dehydrogenase (short-subunit alcohol dehydrogenase family)